MSKTTRFFSLALVSAVISACQSDEGGALTLPEENLETPKDEADASQSADAGGADDAGSLLADDDTVDEPDAAELEPEPEVVEDDEDDDESQVEVDASLDPVVPVDVEPEPSPASNDAGQAPIEPEPEPVDMQDDAGWPVEHQCIYHSDPVPPEFVDAGADAGPIPGPHLTVINSAFVGPYLADYAGYALYIYTADLPGNCNVPPVSTCFDDCLIAWPVFEAGHRVLAEGLDDQAFGTFVREDGVQQTTYYGWPLYYYKKDEAPEMAVGQGKGKVWYLAETVLPNLMIMRAPEELEGVRYLADGSGHTLYTYTADQLGTESRPPRSSCVGACAESLIPFQVRSLRAVTALEPDDLSVFLRPDGVQQISFRGQPLYLAIDDEQSGEVNGLLLDGAVLALP